MMETSCDLGGNGAMRCNAELAAAATLCERRRGAEGGPACHCVTFFVSRLEE